MSGTSNLPVRGSGNNDIGMQQGTNQGATEVEATTFQEQAHAPRQKRLNPRINPNFSADHAARHGAPPSGCNLAVPQNPERRSGSTGGASGEPISTSVSRDHPAGILPTLEGEVAGREETTSIPDDFEGSRHFERNGGAVRSNGNNGYISASETSGQIELNRNRSGLTVTNNDGTVSSRGAEKNAIEHIETNSGLCHVTGRSNAWHNIANNRQTIQIGDRDGAGPGDGIPTRAPRRSTISAGVP